MSEFKRVQSGQRLSIPASTWNSVMEATDAYFRRGREVERQPKSQADTVLIYNGTGEDLPRFAVLAFGSPLTDPGDDEDAFASRVALYGTKPTALSLSGVLAIIQEPL